MKEQKVYTQAEAQQLMLFFQEAERMWYFLIKEYIASGKEHGSCIGGAGFTILVKFPRKRKANKVKVVKPNTWSQGSLTWEHSKDQIAQYLKDCGIEFDYDWGWMN